MPYSVGDTVVHPQHGAATVKDVEERRFDGEIKDYLVLRLNDDSMTIKVPSDVIEEVGLRETIDTSDLDAIFSVIEEDPQMTKANWQKRRAKNEARLRSGEPEKIAAVIRDLIARNDIKTLSPTEKRQREKAEEFMIGEIVAATKHDEESAQQLIDEHTTHLVEDPEDAAKAA